METYSYLEQFPLKGNGVIVISALTPLQSRQSSEDYTTERSSALGDGTDPSSPLLISMIPQFPFSLKLEAGEGGRRREAMQFPRQHHSYTSGLFSQSGTDDSTSFAISRRAPLYGSQKETMCYLCSTPGLENASLGDSHTVDSREYV